MEQKELEYRMYFFVPYNISPIQQAIQAGHAALEYAHKFKDHPDFLTFIENHKTWVILNGGTTNEHPDKLGSLNEIYISMLEHDALHAARNEPDNMIRFAIFNEPDLNDALTAVCFIADERVWNYEDYPDFVNFIIESVGIIDSKKHVELRMTTMEDLILTYPATYEKWVNFLGGEKNIFLRELIKGKKLA